MKKILLSVCILAVISYTSCREDAPEDAPTETSPATSNVIDTMKNIFKDSTKTTFTTNQPTLPSLPEPYKASNTVTALNPQHGQLGHRCDIAVGAPLNSPPQNIQQTMPATQTIPATPTPAINANGTVKLNPAHGQPGHDCTIPVGQPLKS